MLVLNVASKRSLRTLVRLEEILARPCARHFLLRIAGLSLLFSLNNAFLLHFPAVSVVSIPDPPTVRSRFWDNCDFQVHRGRGETNENQ